MARFVTEIQIIISPICFSVSCFSNYSPMKFSARTALKLSYSGVISPTLRTTASRDYCMLRSDKRNLYIYRKASESQI